MIHRGNNHTVVERVLKKRVSWIQIPVSSTLFDFKWTPNSNHIRFDFLGKHGTKSLVNHF